MRATIIRDSDESAPEAGRGQAIAPTMLTRALAREDRPQLILTTQLSPPLHDRPVPSLSILIVNFHWGPNIQNKCSPTTSKFALGT
jgi:hypothetical protein